MDFIVQLPKTKTTHKDAIVVFVDYLSKQDHFQVVTTNITAPETARVFIDSVFKLHGLPQVIVCDRDARFTSNFWQALFKLLNTRLAMSTAFHPQTDGQTERTNRTLEQILRNYVSYRQDDWDQHLTMAEFAYNNSKQASTSLSLFYLNYGFHPSVPTTIQTTNTTVRSEERRVGKE